MRTATGNLSRFLYKVDARRTNPREDCHALVVFFCVCVSLCYSYFAVKETISVGSQLLRLGGGVDHVKEKSVRICTGRWLVTVTTCSPNCFLWLALPLGRFCVTQSTGCCCCYTLKMVFVLCVMWSFRPEDGPDDFFFLFYGEQLSRANICVTITAS